MDYYESEENAELKNRVYEKIAEEMRKRLKRQRKLMLIIFGAIGITYLAVGIVFLAVGVTDVESGMNPGYIFAPMGAAFVLFGLLLFAFMPKTVNTEKLKRRISDGKYGYYDTLMMLTMQRAEVEILKERVNELEEDIRRLKND